jgi:hypothetical protein
LECLFDDRPPLLQRLRVAPFDGDGSRDRPALGDRQYAPGPERRLDLPARSVLPSQFCRRKGRARPSGDRLQRVPFKYLPPS